MNGAKTTSSSFDPMNYAVNLTFIIVSQNIDEKVEEMKGFRNFLVHRYGTIDDEVAFKDIKKGLLDFELFKKEIQNFLKKYE